MPDSVKNRKKGRHVKHVWRYCEKGSAEELIMLRSYRQKKTEFIKQPEKADYERRQNMGRIKQIGSGILSAAVISCMMVTTVMADPSTDDLEQQKSEAESKAEDLQTQLTGLLNKIGEMEEELIATGEKITQTEQDLEEAEQKAEEQYSAMKVRIKYMYEKGESDVWEALLTAEDFTDFLNKAEYAGNVHSYDREQLEELQKTQEEITELKESLETEQADLEKQQEEYTAEEERINAELEEKKAEVADFDVQIQAAAEEAARQAAEREAEESSTGGESQTEVSTGNESEDTGNSGSSGGSSSGGSSSSGNTSSGNTAVAQAIVNAAYSQLGVPYVYGGTTPGVGLDCSGLVQYCHQAAGISLPRTSQAQGGCGVAVTDPQPGDIVCYGGHVGIYIGNGQMIHAPQTGDVVKIADVYGSPWYRRCW